MSRHEIEMVGVLGQPMEVFVFRPTTQTTCPGIVLAQHIPVGHTGIENDEFTLVTAQRLCDAGFAVAIPFIFHWWEKNEGIVVKRDAARDDWMVADCQAAFDLLAADPMVDKDRIGVVGHCWGGRVAWLFACHNSRLAACTVFYGGRVMIPMGATNKAPIELTHQIGCKVAGFFGNDDTNPTPADVDDYELALRAGGVECEFHRYDGARHAFQNFPSGDTITSKRARMLGASYWIF